MGIINGNISGLYTSWESKLSLVIFCGCRWDGYYKTINRLEKYNLSSTIITETNFEDNISELHTSWEI